MTIIWNIMGSILAMKQIIVWSKDSILNQKFTLTQVVLSFHFHLFKVVFSGGKSGIIHWNFMNEYPKTLKTNTFSR